MKSFTAVLMVVIGLFLGVDPAGGITWEFASDSGGWTAIKGLGSRSGAGSLLRTEVREGVWRIGLSQVEPGEVTAFELLSPRIGQRWDLFDFVRVRLRLWDRGPAGGLVDVVATMEIDGATRSSFVSASGFKLGIDPETGEQAWGEITLPLPLLSLIGSSTEGTLERLRLRFGFHTLPEGQPLDPEVIP